MNEGSIRIGVAGLGKMGLVHAAIFNGLAGSRVVAAADPADWARSALKGTDGSMRVYADVAKMVDSEELDALVIATPVAHHVPMAMDCVERGLPFFMEKPLTTHASHAEPLLARIEQRPLPHMIAYMTRFVDSFVKGKELLASGCLGRVYRMSGTIYVAQLFGQGQGWRYERAVSGGGVLLSQGSHLLDILTWYFGPVARVNAQVDSVYSREVEDFAHLILEFESGLTGWVDSSWSMRFRRTVDTTIEVYGERGVLIVTDDTVRLFLEEGVDGFESGWTSWSAAELYRGVELDIGGPQYTREDQAFLQALREGRAGEVDLRQAVHVQRIVDAAYASTTSASAPVEVKP